MANSRKEKKNKNPDRISKDIAAIIFVLLIIAGYIIYECYSVTNVDVETVTAVTSTVYETVEAKALVIRDEQVVQKNDGSVTVPCVSDGEKVKMGGNIAMIFSSEDNAKSYANLLDLHSRLDYYIELESKSAGIATDVETIDRDILKDVNEYIIAANGLSFSDLEQCSYDLNDELTRRQMIIGEKIDFSAVKESLQTQINEINTDACSPTGYVSADKSGIFSSYVDGLENSFDYENVTAMDIKTLNSYIEKAQNAESDANHLGKLINSYKWYFCCVVSSDDIKGVKNGDVLTVALKNSDKILECCVESGADVDLGEKETVLVLSCSEMDGAITSMRLEDIEIRYDSYTGFKVPSSAIHVDSEGKKCVYALVANQVCVRYGEIIYSTKDYSVFAYDAQNGDSIRLYDQIITKGKDLHDGKVYT